MKLAYLAAPYSDPDPLVVIERIRLLYLADAMLMERGIYTVSPLLKHAILEHRNLPGDWQYWKDYSLELMRRCDELIVLMLPGWDKSAGVAGEIEAAEELGIPIIHINVEDWKLEVR